MSLIQIEEITTVKTNDTTLPILTRSEDAKAIASFPDFQVCVHPEYIFEGGMQALDRSSGLLCPNSNGQPILTGTFPNGALGFDVLAQRLAGGAGTGRINSPRTFNLKEFSVAFVLYYVFTAEPTTSHNLMNSISGLTTNFRLVINPSRSVSMINPSGAGAADPVKVPSGIATAYMACYSDGKGATLYRGNEVAMTGNLDFGRTSDDQYYTITSSANFLDVCSAALNSAFYTTTVDLSKPENDGRRAAIIKYLTDKYIN